MPKRKLHINSGEQKGLRLKRGEENDIRITLI